MSKIKLQKAVQSAGIDSRRKIRQSIHEGKFKVNDKVVKDPNFLIDPALDAVRLKNKKLDIKPEATAYFILNKPYGVICTLDDPQGRPTIKEFITKIKERVYPVGRLDYNSEGLILLTNDGELTNFIISPRNQIPKLYLVKIKGTLKEAEAEKLKSKGIFMDGIRVKPLKIDFVRKTGKDNSWLNVAIIEGKKHILRKMFKYLGHPVEKLKRTAIGTFKLKKLPPGHWRELTEEEVAQFKKEYNFKTEID
ncbi:MAG: rRNA pseudouridine synthase [Candidatus Aminicenantes bacterium]|nr:rRNA pseudouridine synthase [Candidatus Aminicenantes bacterium]